MKLIIQSDDYGITRAQALGCLKGIRDGITRNTGIFLNRMPWNDEIIEWIKPYIDQIDLGIDLNCSTGWPLCDPSEVPSLCQENGRFLTSSMNRALDAAHPDHDHFNYEEIYKEYEAQIKRFIETFGKKPAYIQGHVYYTPTLKRAQDELAAKYGVRRSHDIIDEAVARGIAAAGPNDDNSWYQERTYDAQEKAHLEDYLLEDRAHLLGKEFGVITCHTGYVDRELMDLSTFNIFRLNDLDAVCSPRIKEWMKENNIEPARFSDLDKRLGE